MKRKKAALGMAILIILTLLLAACGSSGGKAQEEDYRQQGIELMDAGKYKEAAQMFQLALNQSFDGLDDLDMDIAYYRAAALYKSGETGDALQTYDAIINNDASSWKAYYMRGTIYLDEDNTASADADYTAAVTYNSSDYDLYIQIYKNLHEKGIDSADEYLDTALKIGGSTADALCSQGEIQMLKGDQDQARSLFEQASQQGSRKALLYLAQLSIEKEDYSGALSYIENGLSQESGSADELDQQFRFAQIVAEERMGEWETAKNLMSTYLEDYPNDLTAQRESTFLLSR